MPPFAQFWLWMREGPLAERRLAAVAAVVLLGLCGLALVPITGSSRSLASGGGTIGGVVVGTGAPSGQTASGQAQGAGAAAAGAGAVAAGSSSGGASAGAAAAASQGRAAAPGGAAASSAPGSASPVAASPGAGGGATASSCGGRAASGPGVSATEVHIDFAYANLAGPVVNSQFGILPYIGQAATALVDTINKSGGVACGRKLVLTEYQVNPVDSNDQQTKCLQMVQDAPIEVINYAGYVTPQSYECFVQNHVPLLTITSFGKQLASSSYPYLSSLATTTEEQVRDSILGLAARDWFKAPRFGGKLGVFEDSCLPSANDEVARDLAASGVSAAQTSTYTMDCALVGQPNQIAQAVLQNKVANDTSVFLDASVQNDENYVQLADQQNFHPQYLTTDYGEPEAPGQTYDSGFDGAVDITSTLAGELDSGIHSPAELTCNNILVQNGMPAIGTGNSEDAGSICDVFFLFAQDIGHAGTNPTRASLIESLASMGPFQSAWEGNAVFDTPNQVTGGTFQREIQYHISCQCWKVVDAAEGPEY